MKLDLLLIPVGARYPEMRAAAVAAEEAGFDGVWTWDHLRDPDESVEAGVPEAWTVLAALAEATRRITLGPLVLNTGLRHPGLLANMAATLQQVSGGRLLLGIGAGATPSMAYAREQTSLGMAVAGDRVRAERVAETVQVLRRLWSGDASSYTGSQFRLDRPSGYLRPDPPPPIIVGGVSRHGTRRVLLWQRTTSRHCAGGRKGKEILRPPRERFKWKEARLHGESRARPLRERRVARFVTRWCHASTGRASSTVSSRASLDPAADAGRGAIVARFDRRFGIIASEVSHSEAFARRPDGSGGAQCGENV